MATPVEQIKQRLSIVEVVSSYVVLQKAGKSLKGKSPFTNERTPSFFVSPDRGMYYCFSTGKGGDIFSFIQEMEGVDFRGALTILAERAGVELTAVDPHTRDERERLFALLADATAYFVTERDRNPAVRTYLHARGLKDETIQKWQIGYAPAGWRNLKDHLTAKGYSEDLIFRAGLLIRTNDARKGSYDVFRDRVMFPIAESSGRVVGFSGRIFSDDPGAPKYVNSPETDLFVKSHVLFGYDKAKNGIRNLDFSLVVEGQFDLVLSHQAGYGNTVALSGTALTTAHVELLQRLSNRVVLALDADRAGISSVKRSADVLLRRGMDVKVARVVGGKDPADLVKEDPKLLRHAVGAAEHVVQFLLAVIKDDVKDERTFRLRVRDEVLPFIALMPSRIDQEHFEHLVAEALGVTNDAIRQEVAQLSARAEPAAEAVSAPVEPRREAPQKRPEDIAAHLFGIYLWQQAEISPVVPLDELKQNLELVLGHDSMQSLLDWPDERKNEAIFKTEAVYGESNALPLHTADLLRELYILELRRRLVRARETLREAEDRKDAAAAAEALNACSSISETLKQVVVAHPFRRE